MNSDTLQTWQRRFGADCVVRVGLGALLVLGALAKGLSPASSAVAVLDGWPFAAMLFVVQAELAFGVVLIIGLWRSCAHDAAIVVFAGFAVVALLSVLIGEESCGCFGSIAVDPRLTLLVDLAAITSLFATRSVEGKKYFSSTGKQGGTAAAVIVLIGIPLGIAMATMAPVRGGDISVRESFVLLEPETWVGKKLPLLAALEGVSGLASGEWTMLVHHHNCPTCERVRPEYEKRLIRGERVLLVETPPYLRSKVGEGFTQGYARLPDDREWFIQTPVEIVLNDGVVVSVERELLLKEEARL